MKRKTSIIILTYNNLDYTKSCVDSILKYTDRDTYELIIVDNASTDGTKEWLKEQENMKIIYNKENVGFPKGCNQGIEIAEKTNDILLLNNDTIVTKNWLNNLKLCLDSSDTIGAVGAVCNQNENKQGVDFVYEDFNTMQTLAKENNVSDPTRWEEKAFLIGFCLLIKREVMNNLGGLDEGYTPGYIEDNDLSLRILKLGYRLMLCHDAFIHHYLGTAFRKDLSKFYPILNKNRDYFFSKWKFTTFSFDQIKEASFPLLENPKEVLELNCGIGVTILALKYKYKEIAVEGVESDENQACIARRFATVYKDITEVKKKYDTILIGNILEHIENPQEFLNKMKYYLKPNGCIIGEIHNAASIKNISKLLDGECNYLYSKKENAFTILDIKRMTDAAGFTTMTIFSWYEQLDEEKEKLVNFFKDLNPNLAYTYITFKAVKTE